MVRLLAYTCRSIIKVSLESPFTKGRFGGKNGREEWKLFMHFWGFYACCLGAVELPWEFFHSTLFGRVGRKKETHKISVILRLIKTAIFHDSPEFWLSSVGRAYYRGEHSWTPTGETHTSWGDVWRSKEWDASLILSRDHRRVMRGFLCSSNQGWTPRERVARDRRYLRRRTM